MRGNDCNVTPDWWPLGMVPLEQANAAHALDIITHHKRLHSHECVRMAAAKAYLDQQNAPNKSTDSR